VVESLASRSSASSSTFSASRVKFVLIGNSCRPKNGLCGLLGMYGGVGPDCATKYTVIDCARQWDKWADYPNLDTNPDDWIATANVWVGDSATYNIHVSYQGVDVAEPGASVTFGNVTFQLFETTPIPLGPSCSRSQIEPGIQPDRRPRAMVIT
jgi:hypothetical protein